MALAAAAAGTWLVQSPSVPPAPQARQYLNVSACLLTGPQGVVPGSPAAPVWSSMQAASVSTHVMVSYLPGTGQQQVPVLLNTLAQRRCGVIITSGATPAQVAAAAKANPRQQFLLITGTGAGGMPANTAVVTPAAASERIDQTLRALAATA